MRLEKSQVRYSSVASLPGNYFKIIATAKDLADLSELDKKAAELSSKTYGAIAKIANQTIVNLITGKNNGNK